MTSVPSFLDCAAALLEWLASTDDDTSPALIRYVQTRSGFFTFGPDRAIGATLPQQRAAGVTLGMRF